MILFNWLNAEKKLCQIIKHPTREGIVILTPGILQIIITFVVEHFVGGEVHCSIQELKIEKNGKIIKKKNVSFFTVKPERSHPSPQKIRASMRPII